MKRFELFEPVSLEAATRLLIQRGEKGSILAGGTVRERHPNGCQRLKKATI